MKRKKENLNFLKNNIGYVDMGTSKVRKCPSNIEELKPTKAIILTCGILQWNFYEEISNFFKLKPKGICYLY